VRTYLFRAPSSGITARAALPNARAAQAEAAKLEKQGIHASFWWLHPTKGEVLVAAACDPNGGSGSGWRNANAHLLREAELLEAEEDATP